MSPHLSNHLVTRAQQRIGGKGDVELVLVHGSQCDGGVLLTSGDVEEAVSELKYQMSKLQKLVGTFIALDDDHTVAKTTYRATRRQSRQKLGG